MKKVSLAIRDFALPVPRKGSIDALSGYGRASAIGQETHQIIQSKRAQEHDNYEAEVAITHEFERGGFIFEVSGRMDGLFSGKTPKIEEIKTTFSVWELHRRLRDAPNQHPYCLQLQTYGYLYWLQNKVMPKLSFHLVSTRKTEEEDLDIRLDLGVYEAWLDLRLNELVEEAQHAEKRAAKRRKNAEAFTFPFEKPRTGQIELIQTIDEGMSEHRRMLIQAPTGLGKTVGVLFPALREALSRGQRVIYVTPKNSQHSVAEDAVVKLQETGAKIRSLTVTAKSKICFKNEPLCNPEYCEFAKDHYTKVAEHKIMEQLSKKRKLSARTFEKIGKEFEVCPFELQLDAAQDVETVICDYNYVFAPRSAFGRLTESGLDQDGKPNLVIDEAHNLPARAMDYHSPALSSVVLERMREDLVNIPSRFQSDASELIDECIQVVLNRKPKDSDKPSKIETTAAAFQEQDTKLRTFLSQYLEADTDIQPRDVVLRLCFYWSEFTAALEFACDRERTEFFITFHPHHTGGTIKITCCDASEMLKECYDDFEQVVGFSATLKPFEFYSRLAGLETPELKTAEFSSPFPAAHRKLLIIPQISSKYSDRQRNYPRIAETIQKISALKPGNYFAFFPSFEFLERTLEQFSAPPGFMVLRQERGMRNDDVQAVLEHLRAAEKTHSSFCRSRWGFLRRGRLPGQYDHRRVCDWSPSTEF